MAVVSTPSRREAGDRSLDRNEVLLVGRLAAPAQERTLPSGDTVVGFRLVVRREGSPASPPRATRAVVDTIDCTVWHRGLQRAALRWTAGDVIEIEGALRRRFFRSAGGPASRHDIDVVRGRRLRGSPS